MFFLYFKEMMTGCDVSYATYHDDEYDFSELPPDSEVESDSNELPADSEVEYSNVSVTVIDILII